MAPVFKRNITTIGSIVMFTSFVLFYQLAWNEVLSLFWLNKIFSYGMFLGAALMNWGLAKNEPNRSMKYLVYNTLSVFFLSLFLVYGFQTLVIHVFKFENFKEILKGFNKLMLTIILTTLLCLIYHLFLRKRS